MAKSKKKDEGMWTWVNTAVASAIGGLILAILGFKSPQQLMQDVGKGVETAWDFISMKIKRYRGIFFALLALTVCSGLGAFNMDGGGYLVLFALSSVLLVMYVAILFVGGFLLAGVKAGKEFTKASLQSIGKLFNHILYWECAMIFALLLYDQWQGAGRTIFIMFAVGQIALFIINDVWRRRVRAASVLVISISCFCFFASLTWPHMPEKAKREAKLIDHSWELSLNERERASRLPKLDQVFDVNRDDEVDSVDVRLINTELAMMDTSLVPSIEFDGNLYRQGDFDNDRNVDTTDGRRLYDYLYNKGVAPVVLDLRHSIAFNPPPKPNVDKLATNPSLDTTVHHVLSRNQGTVQQGQPTEPPSVSAQYASATTVPTRTVVKKQPRNVNVSTPSTYSQSSFPLALEDDESFFNSVVEKVERNGQYVIVRVSWSNPVTPTERASIHRGSTRLCNTKTGQKYLLRKFTGIPVGKAEVIGKFGKKTAELYFPGNIPAGEYLFELCDFWGHRFTTKIVV